jgi:hypothetical protein
MGRVQSTELHFKNKTILSPLSQWRGGGEGEFQQVNSRTLMSTRELSGASGLQCSYIIFQII